MGTFLNFVAISYRAANALPFGTVVVIILILSLVGFPLVVVGGIVVVIARFGVYTTWDLSIVADIVSIGITWTVTTTIAQCVEVLATAIVDIGSGIECAAGSIRATRNVGNSQVFIPVTNVIGVHICTRSNCSAIDTEGMGLT